MERKNNQIDFNRKFEEFLDMTEREYKRFMKELDKNKERAEWYVRYHPKKALLLSAGTGLFLGLILSNLGRNKR